MRKLGLAALLVSSLAATSCNSIQNYQKVTKLNLDPEKPNSYYIGGIGGNVLGKQALALTDYVNAYPPQRRDYPFWRENISQIREDALSKNPMIIEGHSMGCASAIEMAYEVREINPDKRIILVLFDAGHLGTDLETIPLQILSLGVKRIPSNVDTVINYYSDGFFNGAPISKRHCQSPKTRIWNLNIDTGHIGLKKEKYHFGYSVDIHNALVLQNSRFARKE